MTRQQEIEARHRERLARILPGYNPNRKFRVKVVYATHDQPGERTKTYTVKALDKQNARDKAISQFRQNEYDLDLDYYGTDPNVKEV